MSLAHVSPHSAHTKCAREAFLSLRGGRIDQSEKFFGCEDAITHNDTVILFSDEQKIQSKLVADTMTESQSGYPHPGGRGVLTERTSAYQKVQRIVLASP